MKTSTNYSPKYLQTEHHKVGSNGLWQDPLSPAVIGLRKAVTKYSTITYRGEPITTICRNEYNTTTIWWIVLMYNGYIHPSEIKVGSLLKLPNRDQISAYLGRNRSVFGTIATI